MICREFSESVYVPGANPTPYPDQLVTENEIDVAVLE
jgi:hypothetical protein